MSVPRLLVVCFAHAPIFFIGCVDGIAVDDAGSPIDAGGTDADAGSAPDAGSLDAGTDAGVFDAGVGGGSPRDAGVDAGAPLDAGADAGSRLDAGVDAGAPDAGVDAGAPVDADAGVDAGPLVDAGPSDAGVGGDAGPEVCGIETPTIPDRPAPTVCNECRPPSLNGGGVGFCESDADCTGGDNGRCVDGGFATICSYDECFDDSDCEQDELCACDIGRLPNPLH